MLRFLAGYWILLGLVFFLWMQTPYFMSVGYISIHSYAFFAAIWGICHWKNVSHLPFTYHLFAILTPYATWSYLLFWVNETLIR